MEKRHAISSHLMASAALSRIHTLSTMDNCACMHDLLKISDNISTGNIMSGMVGLAFLHACRRVHLLDITMCASDREQGPRTDGVA